VGDPYGIFFRWTPHDFFPLKSEIYTHTRLFKAYAVVDRKPRTVVLGSSRAQLGIDATHPGFRVQPAFNYSIWAVNSYELMRFFEHGVYASNIAQAVIGLDWFYFNATRSPAKDFDERILATTDYPVPLNRAAFLISIDTLRSSLKTIGGVRETSYAFDLITGQPTAQSIRDQKISEAQHLGGMRGLFAFNTRDVLRTIWGPEFAFEDQSRKSNSLEHFRRIVRLAYEHNIDLRMFISPAHAWLWEAMYQSSRGELWELWKRELVRISEEEAERAHKPPFPIWDFSGYNSLTTETVPAGGDGQTEMRWYWECSHYKRELGDVVLDRVLNYQDSGRPAVRDFGVRLTGRNIDEHLHQIRLDRERYRNSHKEDIKEVATIVYESGSGLAQAIGRPLRWYLTDDPVQHSRPR